MEMPSETSAAVHWEPLPGGWSGQSFLAGTGQERTVVRICAAPGPRGAHEAQVDAALMRWVRGLVPVPEVLEVRPAVDGQPALLVTRYVPGPRADDVVRDAAPDVLAAVGVGLGRVAATLSGVATTAPGHFVDEQLRLAPCAEDEQDLPAYVARRAEGLAHLGADGLRRLDALARDAQEVLDEVGRTSLVHGDLNPRNVVLEPGTHRVAAVVDWEHAHSGLPHADLGNLLRFERHVAWEESVLAAWALVRGEDAALARHRARCADLFALVELASRAPGNLVVDLARLFLAEVVRTGDVHAHP